MLSPLSITVIKQMHLDTETQLHRTHMLQGESVLPVTLWTLEDIDIYLQAGAG